MIYSLVAEVQIHLLGLLVMISCMETGFRRLVGLMRAGLEVLFCVRMVGMTLLMQAKVMTLSTGGLATIRLTPVREPMKFTAVWAMIRSLRVPVLTPSGEALQMTTLA